MLNTSTKEGANKQPWHYIVAKGYVEIMLFWHKSKKIFGSSEKQRKGMTKTETQTPILFSFFNILAIKYADLLQKKTII